MQGRPYVSARKRAHTQVRPYDSFSYFCPVKGQIARTSLNNICLRLMRNHGPSRFTGIGAA